MFYVIKVLQSELIPCKVVNRGGDNLPTIARRTGDKHS